jgi:spore maturation protein CgeB
MCLTERNLFSRKRDLDIVFVGALFPNKMPLLAEVKKSFGRRFRMYGLCNLKKNVYWNWKYRFPDWIRPLPHGQYPNLYGRAKIGLNVHNRGKYTVGGYRMFDLPANGVMQISDGGEYLDDFFEVNREIVGYETATQLIEKLDYYLSHDEERNEIARNGFIRAVGDYTAKSILRRAAVLIGAGLESRRKSEE